MQNAGFGRLQLADFVLTVKKIKFTGPFFYYLVIKML